MYVQSLDSRAGVGEQLTVPDLAPVRLCCNDAARWNPNPTGEPG
jgi:hypothetical protein